MPNCICKTCSKSFHVRPSQFKNGVGKYCSLHCRNIGYKTTLKGCNNPFYGKKHSKEALDKMSLAKKGKPCNHIKTKFKPNDKRVTGKNNYNWKGGKYSQSKGYILVLKKDHPFANNQGYIFEHRLVVEKYINRFLTPTEIVHHKGKKNDNLPHLLMAFVNDSAHQRFHKNPDKVKQSEIIFDGSQLSSY